MQTERTLSAPVYCSPHHTFFFFESSPADRVATWLLFQLISAGCLLLEIALGNVVNFY